MKKYFVITVLTLGILIFACTKNQLGGKSTINGQVLHHTTPIPNASVFIKFDATEFPGSDTTLYDDKVQADMGGNYSLKCYKGEYYLYAFGFDYNTPAPFHVTGGVPAKVRNKETVKADIAVTE